ncbi:hypothetical protein MKX01_010778 [Papaver californicum]|nr:hypothetical protein MKX01_010778 [Papaver californicum]
MGPLLASQVFNLYIIWYGNWNTTHQTIIRDFLNSLSSNVSSSSIPSVSDWWQTVRLYTDQTGEYHDTTYSHGTALTRMDIQSIIKTATNTDNTLIRKLPLISKCGTQCPGICAFPFALPKYNGGGGGANGGLNNPSRNVMDPPNGDVGVDGMISVIAHELAEVSSNPLLNAWYAGDDPIAPTDADFCVGVYGSGGGGGYVGKTYKDRLGNGYNLIDVNGRKFLVQWVWNPARKRCYGPNAMD